MAPPELILDEADDHSALEAQIVSNKRVNVCLTESNFLLWKQQVVLTIRGLGLEGYLDGSLPCPVKLARNRAVGSETTAAVWNSITKLYSTLSTTKIMNLHCRLRSMKKGTQSMRDYTTAIKKICDLLAACGSSISNVEHIATILNGLPIEYEPSVATITASKETYTVENVVSILVDAETRLEDSSRYSIGINYTKYGGKIGDKNCQESDAVTTHDEGRYKEVSLKLMIKIKIQLLVKIPLLLNTQNCLLFKVMSKEVLKTEIRGMTMNKQLKVILQVVFQPILIQFMFNMTTM
ncbi:hypothetical protein GQ457_01G019930 [Hibiscus cannabinus]